MGKIIAIANQKGGVGKTTTTINLAASLGILGKKILIIDADPQANATSGIGFTEDDVVYSSYDCLIGEIPTNQAILPTAVPNVDLIASSIDLVGAEIELVNVSQREYRLKRALDQIRNNYDYIFIDCLPSLGLLTLNALTACDSVLIPLQCEIYAFEGLSKLKNTIHIVKQSLNPELEIEGLLLSMFDQRLRLANVVVNEVREFAQDYVFHTIIHRNSKIGEAPSMKQPVLMYDARSQGAVNFLNLAKEFLQKNNAREAVSQ